MRHRQMLAALITLVLVAMLALATTAAAAKGGKAERVVRYWTPARQQAAISRDFVTTARGFRPAVKLDWAGGNEPGDGGDDGDSGADGSIVTGATWSDPSAEVRGAVGKVFFRVGGTVYTCSGSVTYDTRSGFSLVPTAAHCAYDERNDTFAEDWIFIPHQSSRTQSWTTTAYGCWTTAQGALVAPKGYAQQDTFNDAATRHDFAFAGVGPGGKGGDKQLDDSGDGGVGAFPITTSTLDAGARMSAFGYPAPRKYKGTKLTYCQGPIFYDAGR